MKYYIRLADDNKTICGASYSKEDDTIEVETDEEIYGIAFGGYQLIDGKVVKDAKTYRKRRILEELDELKDALLLSDYKAIKYSEGELSEEEYSPTRIERREFRNTIRKLEKELLELEE